MALNETYPALHCRFYAMHGRSQGYQTGPWCPFLLALAFLVSLIVILAWALVELAVDLVANPIGALCHPVLPWCHHWKALSVCVCTTTQGETLRDQTVNNSTYCEALFHCHFSPFVWKHCCIQAPCGSLWGLECVCMLSSIGPRHSETLHS